MGVVNVTPDSFSDGGQFLDHGNDAAQLLVDRYRLGAGARGLPTDVDPVGAQLDRRPPVRDGHCVVEELATVGERVGGDVDDAHDQALGGLHEPGS